MNMNRWILGGDGQGGVAARLVAVLLAIAIVWSLPSAARSAEPESSTAMPAAGESAAAAWDQDLAPVTIVDQTAGPMSARS